MESITLSGGLLAILRTASPLELYISTISLLDLENPFKKCNGSVPCIYRGFLWNTSLVATRLVGLVIRIISFLALWEMALICSYLAWKEFQRCKTDLFEKPTADLHSVIDILDEVVRNEMASEEGYQEVEYLHYRYNELYAKLGEYANKVTFYSFMNPNSDYQSLRRQCQQLQIRAAVLSASERNKRVDAACLRHQLKGFGEETIPGSDDEDDGWQSQAAYTTQLQGA
ncbi:hypothetical protein MD484_g635, partial [Candolleomyces efflorescens]